MGYFRAKPLRRMRNAGDRWNTSMPAAYASWGLQDRITQGSFEDFARNRFIIGDKGSVKEEVARYRELLGVDHFIMRCQWPGLPQEQALSSIRRLGEIFAS